jgi:hypothetical protein
MHSEKTEKNQKQPGQIVIDRSGEIADIRLALHRGNEKRSTIQPMKNKPNVRKYTVPETGLP